MEMRSWPPQIWDLSPSTFSMRIRVLEWEENEPLQGRLHSDSEVRAVWTLAPQKHWPVVIE